MDKYRVLVVEDDQDLRRTIVEALERNGFDDLRSQPTRSRAELEHASNRWPDTVEDLRDRHANLLSPRSLHVSRVSPRMGIRSGPKVDGARHVIEIGRHSVRVRWSRFELRSPPTFRSAI